MLKPIEITETNHAFGVDEVCVLYANARYAKKDGVVTECLPPN
jgi:hypothetical protein